jgi:O-antigen/teichoic acid export membrane protein
VIANILRAGVTFATGTLIARGLSPSGYGDLTFLLGSFIAIRALLDMGTSSAFYTFISRNVRSSRFYFIYLAWLGLQFIITFALIVFLIPSNIFERIWLNQIRETVALGFVAVFCFYRLIIICLKDGSLNLTFDFLSISIFRIIIRFKIVIGYLLAIKRLFICLF